MKTIAELETEADLGRIAADVNSGQVVQDPRSGNQKTSNLKVMSAAQRLLAQRLLEWQEAILRIICHFPSGTIFTFDHVRIAAHEGKIGLPPHQNNWGSIMTIAKKDGLVVKTGNYRTTAVPSSHHRVLAEWRRL